MGAIDGSEMNISVSITKLKGQKDKQLSANTTLNTEQSNTNLIKNRG
jgi:hypothetical protein